MKLRPYQEELVSAVVADVTAGVSEVVLAGCPGSGKTLMSIAAISRLLASGEVKRVLVLTHGTKLLRSQYAEALNSTSPGFTWTTVINRSRHHRVPLSEVDAQVTVALPQGITHGEIPSYDLVVVDEAHHFYAAQMVSSIVERTGTNRVLCLTGTPFPFVAKGAKIHAASMQEVFDAGNASDDGPWISDAEIKLLQSHHNVRYSQYNHGGEIEGGVPFGKPETERTLDDVGAWISRNRTSESWPTRLRRIGKTMLVCRSQEIAMHAGAYFADSRVKFELSTSDTDDGDGIERFKEDPSIGLLIVVRRANLGFDFPGLSTVVDMTGSINIDRIFQMFARTVRPSPGIRKTFVKIASGEMFEYTRAIMRASLLLAGRSLYLSWNGISLGGIVVPGPVGTAATEGRKPTAGVVGNGPLPDIDDEFLLFEDFFRVETGADGRLIGGVTLGAVAVALGFKASDPNPTDKKRRLLEFYATNGRPVRDAEPLYGAQVDRVWKDSDRFDQEVFDAAVAVGYRPRGRYDQWVGQRFGKLTVTSISMGTTPNGKRTVAYAMTRCECGNEKKVLFSNIKNSNSKSCGCDRDGRHVIAVVAAMTPEERSAKAKQGRATSLLNGTQNRRGSVVRNPRFVDPGPDWSIANDAGLADHIPCNGTGRIRNGATGDFVHCKPCKGEGVKRCAAARSGKSSPGVSVAPPSPAVETPELPEVEEGDEEGWSKPDTDGRQTCVPCRGEGIDRRPGEGAGACCLNCDGEGYRWPSDDEGRRSA